MKEYGGLKIPIKSPVNVPLTCNQDAIDFLLDIKFKNMYKGIKEIYNDKKLSLTIIKATTPIYNYPYSFDVFTLVISHPPKYWCKFKGQKYIIVVSKLLYDMIHYFMSFKALTRSKQEFDLLNIIIRTIEDQIIQYKSYGIY